MQAFNRLWQRRGLPADDNAMRHTFGYHFALCCEDGRVPAMRLAERMPPGLLCSLFTGDHLLSREFMRNIRRYNSLLGFTSFGARVVPGACLGAGPGPPVCIVHGQVYHYSHQLFLEETGDEGARFVQLYMMDVAQATARRCDFEVSCGKLESVGQGAP